jgi:hypothetical protein
MFPVYAIVILVLAFATSALVWSIGAHLRVKRGEPALPDFKSMMGRGWLAPLAILFLAADFGATMQIWLVWTALVVGGWLLTLIVVRGVLAGVYRDRARRPRATTVDMEPEPEKMAG